MMDQGTPHRRRSSGISNPRWNEHARKPLGSRRTSPRLEQLESRFLLHCTAFDLPHADDPVRQGEHLAVLELVPCEAVTHEAKTSGEWDDPSIWDHGIPGKDSNILVPAGIEVLIDSVLTDAPRSIRIDGSLKFATHVNTGLRVDTIVVTPGGSLTIGTHDDPIRSEVEAKIQFADRGPMDGTWDPHQFSRGLISHGTVHIDGADKTPFVALTEGPRKKATRLVLAEVPQGWETGDQLVVTGVKYNARQDEQVGIRSISGNTITLDRRLRHSHAVSESGLSAYVANLTRNVVFQSENSLDVGRRGHVMFMHSGGVEVRDAAFYGLGRTDKRIPLNNVSLDPQGMPIAGSGTNQVGRYPVHFHRITTDHHGDRASIRGSVVADSPGWGMVNHSSDVAIDDNFVFNVVGAAFVAEAGDEIGSFRGNLAVRSTGSGEAMRAREKLQDFAHGGDGFWFQGAGVEVENNIAVGQADAGFVYFTEGLKTVGHVTRFPAHYLADPSLAGGKEMIDVGAVPMALFRGNQVFASQRGMEIWFHLQAPDHSTPSVVESLTVWGVKDNGVFMGYSGQTVLKNTKVLGNSKAPIGTGINTNDGVKNITYEDVHVEGFATGIQAPRSGTILIQGGFLRNVQNIMVATAGKHGRELIISSTTQFAPPSDAALKGQISYDVSLVPVLDVKDQDISKFFNPDVILWNNATGTKQIYYDVQWSEHVPFEEVGVVPAYIPAELIGKTNGQIMEEFGLAIGGAVATPDSVPAPRLRGLSGTPATYHPFAELISDKYTRQATEYRLAYKLPSGVKVYESQASQLRAGWNVITRSIDGRNQSFLVYAQADPGTTYP